MPTITDEQIRSNLSIFADEYEDEYYFLRDLKEKADSGEKVANFFLSLYAQLEAKGKLTANQILALRRAMNGEKPNRPSYPRPRPRPEPTPGVEPVPNGSGHIIGRIMKLAYKTDRWGTHLKATVLDDRGFKVWGSVTADITAELETMARERGRDIEDLIVNMINGETPQHLRVSFTASLTRSDRDAAFGFYKRPQGMTLTVRNA